MSSELCEERNMFFLSCQLVLQTTDTFPKWLVRMHATGTDAGREGCCTILQML